MSTVNTTPTNETTPALMINQAELAERQQNWSGFAGHLYCEEIALKAMSKVSIIQCTRQEDIEPTKVSIENAVKVLKDLECRRKQTTSILDDLCDRLREPEKNLKEYIKNSETLFLIQKKIRNEKIQKEQDKEIEIATITAKCKNYKIEQVAKINSAISNGAIKLLESALKEKIAPESINGWLKKFTFKPEKFEFVPPNIKAEHITADELKQLIANHSWYNVHDFAPKFEQAIALQFSDYAVSFANSENALRLAKQEAEKAVREIELKTLQSAAMNTLSSTATASATPVISDIKTSYVINMPDTFESATVIIKAFYANSAKCREYLRVKSFLKLGVDNMIVSLNGVKNSDNNFAPEGVIWGVKEK